MRNSFAFVCFALAVSVVVVVVQADCTRNSVHVSTSGQLASAMIHAQPGDDIILAPGEYNCGFSFAQSGSIDCPIHLYCNKSGAAVISGSLDLGAISYLNITNVTLQATAGPVTSNRGWNLCFTNVRVFGSKERGMRFEKAMQVTVHNCTFDHIAAEAVYLLYSNSFVIEDCVFGDAINDNAILLDLESQFNVIQNNYFFGSGYLTDYPYWIFIRAGSNQILHNHFYNTDQHKMTYGVYVDQRLGNVVFKENFMVLYPQKDYSVGFGISNAPALSVCASNRVFGAPLTDGAIDPSC